MYLYLTESAARAVEPEVITKLSQKIFLILPEINEKVFAL